ncbi:unnamed protein product [Lota lota]
MTDRNPGLAVDRTKVLLFLAAFFQAVSCLALLASCGSDYWLLAWQSCSTADGQATRSSWLHRDDLGHLTPGDTKSQAVDSVMFFHEGLFWRCSFQTLSQTFSLWDLWTGLSLMVVVLMFLAWFHALGVLEQYASKRRASVCPAFHLTVELGPSFPLAPVAVFFSVLAGLLFILIGRDTQVAGINEVCSPPN